MRGPHVLHAHQGPLRTRVGAAFPGSRAVFRGHDLHTELMDSSWLALCALGVNGQRMTPEQACLMEAIWVCTSYPDARIWNNRVAALAGTARSTPALALAGGQAVSEATIYGRRNEYRALSFFKRVHRQMQAGATLAECLARHEAEQGKLPGYGRPLANGDERIEPIMARARELGLADGPHVSLAFEIERHLRAQGRPLRMNFGALVSAFGADMGFGPREFVLYVFAGFVGGMQPVYLEALEKPAGAMFPVACSDLRYEGRGVRDWPRGGSRGG